MQKTPGATQLAIGIEGRISYGKVRPKLGERFDSLDNLRRHACEFQHHEAGLNSPSAHIEALRRFAKVAGAS